MNKFKSFLIVTTFFVIVTIVAGACASSSPSATTPASSTIGQFADAGKAVFASNCRCHGAQGQGGTGPAVIGANASLGKYGSTQKLLDFVSTVMPANAPGSLSQEQYSQVVCFLLVQNNYASSSTTFDPAQLKNIALSK